MNDYLYVYLDESGNFDFSKKGTKYFFITAIVAVRPFHWANEISRCKYDLIEKGHEIEYFHCTEDKQETRNVVFNVINKNLKMFSVHSIVIEKQKTNTMLQDARKFYPKMLTILLDYIFNSALGKTAKNIITFTDRIPVQKERKAVEKSIKQYLASKMKIDEVDRYRIYHHDSKSDAGLQIADYCTWAIMKKWRDDDLRSYDLIKTSIKSEFDVFKSGTQLFY